MSETKAITYTERREAFFDKKLKKAERGLDNPTDADLRAELTASQRRAQDARNELCQRCGRYKEAHKGACDGCRWKED